MPVLLHAWDRRVGTCCATLEKFGEKEAEITWTEWQAWGDWAQPWWLVVVPAFEDIISCFASANAFHCLTAGEPGPLCSHNTAS